MPAKTKKQARFMRLVRKCQKTGECLSDAVEKAAKSMTGKQVHDFAKTTDAKIKSKKKNKKSKKHKTFKEYFVLREANKHCTCPCKGCKIEGNCSKCTEKNCKHEGCICN